MPAPFPHQYETTLVRTLSSRGRLAAAQRPPIPCSPSPQLDGDETSWSSEHLLLSSVLASLHMTFEALAARDGITVFSYDSRATTTVERTSRGLVFTSVTIEVDVEVDAPERVRTTLDEARRFCPIVNALRMPVEIVTNVRESVRKAG